MIRKLLAAMTVLVTVAACAGCSTSAPTPTPTPGPGPTPAPAQDEQRLGEEDLDGDGKGDTVFGVPKPEYTLYTSIHVVAGSGESLLTLTNADGEFAGANMGVIPGAPTPVLIVSRAGGYHKDVMTAYIYDKAARQMVPVKWAGRERETDSLVGEVDAFQPKWALGVWEFGGKGNRDREQTMWVYTDGKLVPKEFGN